MTVSPSFREFVEDQLGEIVPIRTRSMFGGVGVYSGSLFFAIIDDDVLYLKVDEETRAGFEERGLQPFRPYGPGGAELSYREAPAHLLDDPEAFGPWVHGAIGAARRAKEA